MHAQEDEYYQSAYGILLSQWVASLQGDQTKLESDFKAAACSSSNDQSYHRRKTERPPKRATVSMEEIEDEFWEEDRHQSKSDTHILQPVNDLDAPCEETNEPRPALRKHPSSQRPSSNGPSLRERVQVKQVFMEEVEDKDLIAAQNKPTSPKHLLIHVNEIEDTKNDEKLTLVREDVKRPQEDETKEAHQNTRHAETVNVPLPNDLPPPPADLKPIRLSKK